MGNIRFHSFRVVLHLNPEVIGGQSWTAEWLTLVDLVTIAAWRKVRLRASKVLKR